MERFAAAYKHVEQINTLYLSTIETLAMAIDAKDQITHGHIRRVQSYAVGLAKRVGVNDEKLIKAIEAAALLHDTGKLAIPEYILNKPGKLSSIEFEQMKHHASIGADILSAIDFPYPVVPIVRYHHENWDGTGYPQGLKGTDIPIGARILSVVDCFDALTSDRPYRPRLSDEMALQILRQRRGSMYDPLVVDTFLRVHLEIAPTPLEGGPPKHVLNEITAGTQIGDNQLRSTVDVVMVTAEGSSSRSRNRVFEQTIGMCEREVFARVREVIRFSLGVLFLNDVATNELEVAYAFGDSAEFVRGLRIPLGQRLSGWVAVNRQTIINSDAALDLGDIARAASLRVCLSTPVISKDQILGVITLYSIAADGFDDRDQSAIELFVRGAIAPKQPHDRLPV